MNPPPSPLTEAAGLLGSGAIFPRRVGLRPLGAPGTEAHVLAGFKRGGFSVYFGDEPIFHFDLEGRWQRAFVAGTHYLKGLDAEVRAVDRPREGGTMVLRRWTLPTEEVANLDDLIANHARTLGAAVAAGAFALMPPPAPSRAIEAADLAAVLGQIAAWTAPAWAAHRDRYVLAYGDGPPPFLPPDCPNPVILRPPAPPTPATLRDHARTVAALLGRRLGQCRDVFLADAGWLDRSPDAVVALLDAVNDVFPIHPDQGRPRAAATPEDAPRLATIHAWLAAVPAARFEPAAWARFRAAHLGRVTLRVDPSTLEDHEAIRSTIVAAKAAGIGVGLAVFSAPIVLPHFAEFVATLPLDPGDLVSLIACGVAPGRPIAPDPSVLAPWKSQLAAALPPHSKGPRVVTYNPDKQWV